MRKHSKDVLTRIRTDMEKMFREATTLLVNVGVFARPSSGDLGIPGNLSAPETSWGVPFPSYRDRFLWLRGRGFCFDERVRGPDRKKRPPCHRRSRLMFGTGRKKKTAYCSARKSPTLIYSVPGFFSVAPSSAPLDLRMVSNYVSNFDGETVFTELGNLIVNSKRRV